MRKPYIGPSESQSKALAQRERPYAIENARSQRHRQAQPRDLLAWFLHGYRSEMPHAGTRPGGTFVGRPPRVFERMESVDPQTGQVLSTAADLTGGSLLGSPRDDELHRRFIEDGPFACEIAEYEGHKDRNPHYLFPMRAALARLGSSKAFMARVLQRIAMLDGDVQAAMLSFGIIPAIQSDYLDAALYRLWTKYDQEPPARILPSKPREEAA